jgi:hypothetical protein
VRLSKKPASKQLIFVFTLTLSLAATLLVLAGCEIPYVVSRVVYEDPINFVRLEPDPSVFEEIPGSKHSHPAAISPEEMAELLKGFSVREHRNRIQRLISGEAPLEPVFREEEIRLLAPKLSEALVQVEPHERVTFYLSRPQTSIKREITSGGLYVRDHQLHFILGNYRTIYGIPAYGMVYDRRYPTMPTAAKGFDLFFEPPSAVVKQKTPLWRKVFGGEKDEVVINLQRLHMKNLAAQQHRLKGDNRGIPPASNIDWGRLKKAG